MTQTYESPSAKEYEFFHEGILCASMATNESYGGDPGEDETIF